MELTILGSVFAYDPLFRGSVWLLVLMATLAFTKRTVLAP